ncbi:MAG: hypothetical protein U0U66_13685 [Cytophagaceae bacterium]
MWKFSEEYNNSMDTLLKSYGYSKFPMEQFMYQNIKMNNYDIINIATSNVKFGKFKKSNLNIGRYIKIIEDIYQDLKAPYHLLDNPLIGTIRIWLHPLVNNDFRRKHHAISQDGYEFSASKRGLENYIEYIKDAYENYLFPEIDKYNDLKVIDGIINANVKWDTNNLLNMPYPNHRYQRLIIAKLCNNSLYEEIYLNQIHSWENWFETGESYLTASEEQQMQWRKNYEAYTILYQRLKDVPPLQDTRLY